MITVKLKDLIAGSQSLMRLSQMKVPVLVSYEVSKAIIQMRKELEVYEEVRIKLVKELGVENKETRQFDISLAPVEKQNEFYEYINTIIDKEINIDINTIAKESLSNDKNQVEIEPVILADLNFMIK